MLLILGMEFRSRKLRMGNEMIGLNYVFYEYEPHLEQMTISAPKTDFDSYIFLHADTKIQNLNVYGDFGSSKETGLVWNVLKLDVFNLILEMNTSTNFYIARRSRRINLLFCYIDVKAAVIKLNHFNYASIT